VAEPSSVAKAAFAKIARRRGFQQTSRQVLFLINRMMINESGYNISTINPSKKVITFFCALKPTTICTRMIPIVSAENFHFKCGDERRREHGKRM
jgi:hypothetical protein